MIVNSNPAASQLKLKKLSGSNIFSNISAHFSNNLKRPDLDTQNNSGDRRKLIHEKKPKVKNLVSGSL
jgi:hypothetical protein